MATPALNPLVTKIRSAHPGAYDDMDDASLTKAVLAKYPQYSDLAAPPTSSMPGAPSTQPMPQPGALNRFATAAGAATANLIPTRETLSGLMNYKGTPGEGDDSLLPEVLNDAVKGTVRSTISEPFQRAMSGDVAGAAGQFVPNALALAATVKPMVKGLPSLPAGKIAQTVGAVAKPLGVAAEDLPVVGSAVKGVKALGKVRGELADIWGKPAVYPGASQPAAPPPEVTQAASLYRGVKPIEDPAAGLGQIPVKSGSIAQQMAPKAVPFERGALSKLLDKQLGDATGAAPPPDPKAPIYQRGSIAKQMLQSDYFSPEAHAARDAAFTKANPPEAMNDPMPPNLRALFQESAGFEKPAEDIGSKVRAKNPEPTRAEVKSGQIAKAMSAPSEDLTPIVQESVDKANAVPEGHTPVDSSALKSYKYDPQAREFHAQYNSNPSKVHIFGDVGPEEAQAFEAAKSKGTAMQAIKRNPEVARIVNGKRIAVKPVTK